MAGGSDGCGPSFCRLPSIPIVWLAFFDFAFTFGTTIVYFADIVTDILTLVMYYGKGWFYAFGLSLTFIIAPSILLAILECQFLIRAYGKNVKWTTVVLRTGLNIPFQLTVIFYHVKLSYNYLTTWMNQLRKSESNRKMEGNRQMSVSNLADIDDRLGTMQRKAITSVEVPVSQDDPSIIYPAQDDHAWWKALTREQWLAHLNKMKLIESMLESLPQLLINVYLIIKYHSVNPVPVIQYISAVLSYLSLCGGVVRYDKTRKDNEAERLMVDRTLLHSRAFVTRLEWAQILFVSVYKGSFLAARILAFVYFTVFYSWIILIVIFVHWAALMSFLVYLWYPSDLNKVTRQLVQADYKFRAYMFLSQDFIGVFTNSLMGIFISVRPYSYAFLGQPYCFMFWFYLAYIVENVILFLTPGVAYSLNGREIALILYGYEYYIVMIFELSLNLVGAVVCIIYYFLIHKMHIYTRNAYPVITRVQGLCCCSDMPLVDKEWTVCKQAETSEIFYLRKEKLREFKGTYNTIVRGNRKKGRTLECFVDDRGKIFYAPRSRLFRRIPSPEEERTMEMINMENQQSFDNLNDDASHSNKDKESARNATVEETQALLSTEEAPDVSEPVENAELHTTPPIRDSMRYGRDTDRDVTDSASISTYNTNAPPLPSRGPASPSPVGALPDRVRESHQRSIRSDPGRPQPKQHRDVERMSQRLPKATHRSPVIHKESTDTPSQASHSTQGLEKSPDHREDGKDSDSRGKRSSSSSHRSSRHRADRRQEEPRPRDSSGSSRRRHDRNDDSQRSRRSREPNESGRERSAEETTKGDHTQHRPSPVGQTWI